VNFRRTRSEEVSINLTPLIDVVFLLLIFFMVSTTFTKETHLELDLPTSTSEKTLAELNQIEVLVNAQGGYAINGQPLIKSDLTTLTRALEQSANEMEDPPVVIVADAQAPHQSVIHVLDAAGRLGLVKVRIATKQETADQ
jgi:biopolymer transport protein ExbD